MGSCPWEWSVSPKGLDSCFLHQLQAYAAPPTGGKLSAHHPQHSNISKLDSCWEPWIPEVSLFNPLSQYRPNAQTFNCFNSKIWNYFLIFTSTYWILSHPYFFQINCISKHNKIIYLITLDNIHENLNKQHSFIWKSHAHFIKLPNQWIAQHKQVCITIIMLRDHFKLCNLIPVTENYHRAFFC